MLKPRRNKELEATCGLPPSRSPRASRDNIAHERLLNDRVAQFVSTLVPRLVPCNLTVCFKVLILLKDVLSVSDADKISSMLGPPQLAGAA